MFGAFWVRLIFNSGWQLVDMMMNLSIEEKEIALDGIAHAHKHNF